MSALFEAAPIARVDVGLVAMPYAVVCRPALALSLLKAILGAAGISAAALYPNLWFADEVGLPLYQLCAQRLTPELLAGEWTFAGAAFREEAPDAQRYLDRLKEAGAIQAFLRSAPRGYDVIEELRRAREAASRFVDAAARRVVATGARIVGCSSMFQQHTASLALLRRVRELDPAVITMMGGPNCERVMGRATLDRFPWVDYVVSGEADGVIADLCARLLARGRDVSPGDLPEGVLGPADRGARRPRKLAGDPAPGRAVFHAMDALPTPDHSDYFEALGASASRGAIEPGLVLEMSRGCWWGAAHHCTFCGLSDESLVFRAKSPERVLAEVGELEARHGISSFLTVDDILDLSYFRTVLPKLAGAGRERRFFFEVKSTLKRPQAEILERSGGRWLQPGIESLHSGVLKLIDKGAQAYQNIQLLKWGRELGLALFWNFLWGFPGEDDAWYSEMATLIPQLQHLQPPMGMTRVRFDRFSVYEAQPDRFELALRPVPAMAHVYPGPEEGLRDLAFFFAAEGRADPLDPGFWSLKDGRPGAARAHKAITEWRRRFWSARRPELSFEDEGEVMRIEDSRDGAGEGTISLTGIARLLCILGREAPPIAEVAPVLRARFKSDAPDAAVLAAIEDLKRQRLVIAVDGRLVSLPIPRGAPPLPRSEDLPGGRVVTA